MSGAKVSRQAFCATRLSRSPARMNSCNRSAPYLLAISGLCVRMSSSFAAVISRNARDSLPVRVLVLVVKPVGEQKRAGLANLWVYRCTFAAGVQVDQRLDLGADGSSEPVPFGEREQRRCEPVGPVEGMAQARILDCRRGVPLVQRCCYPVKMRVERAAGMVDGVRSQRQQQCVPVALSHSPTALLVSMSSTDLE